MKDKNGRIIYVGKAKNLRARLRSYFGRTDSRHMIPFLVSKIHDIEYIVTSTEKEALILENNLIKKYHPRYNVTFKDDKTYFSIRININEAYPRFQLVRQFKRDGAKYFGPFSSSMAVKKTLHFLQKVFPLRTCKEVTFKTRTRPCIEYEIKRCLAPCIGFIDRAEYHKLLNDAMLFLEGREKKLVTDLKFRMKEASDAMDFEKAAILRDQIKAIETTIEKQHISSASWKNYDIFGLAHTEMQALIRILYIRNGIITGHKQIDIRNALASSAEILSSTIKQYYEGGVSIPDEVVIPEQIEDIKVVEEWLTDTKGEKVLLTMPHRGAKRDLLRMAIHNAESSLHSLQKTEPENETALEDLKLLLSLSHFPHRIECFDISNLGGKYAVGSRVAFINGQPATSEYRRFRIKTKDSADDYGMMYEVLNRRFSSTDVVPDLLIVDGGKGQLGVAQAVFRKLEIYDINTVALAKESRLSNDHYTSTTRKNEDRLYLPNRKNPLYLSSSPRILFLLQRIRDEAHRFAVTYHRSLKKKEDFQSFLDCIPGIGKKRKKMLLTYFKDSEKIRHATPEKLENIEGIGKGTARTIIEHLKKNRQC